jgi:hypothetical protein
MKRKKTRMSNDAGGMGTGADAFNEAGVQDSGAQQVNGNNNRKAPTRFFYEHPAVKDHGSGIALQDLTSFMESFNDYVMSRIKGVGADQYMKSTGQLFETFTVQETVDELLAELADTIAYTNFIAIKVIALSNAIKDKQ